ncbi:four helix bundle protein [Candidatus Omnitrophota bacterium]
MIKFEIQKAKKYDLEERTFKFAKRVIQYVNKTPKSLSSIETGRQLVRTAGSVGANYIEANESLGKKDCALRIKISRKEAKEANYWLRLCEPMSDQVKERDFLIQESKELMNIFGAILRKIS